MQEIDTQPKHPLSTALSQKYAEAILMELPDKQSGLHRPNVEKMCALLEMEAKTAGVHGSLSALDAYLHSTIPETLIIEQMIGRHFPAQGCETSPLYTVSVRSEIDDLPISSEAAFIYECAFRYLEGQQKRD